MESNTWKTFALDGDVEVWHVVHRVALLTSVPLVLSIYKGRMKNWYTKTILTDFGMGFRSFIWIVCAPLINWLLAHNCCLVAFLSQLVHLWWELGVTASFRMFPHDSVVSWAMIKCRWPVWVGGGTGEVSRGKVMVLTAVPRLCFSGHWHLISPHDLMCLHLNLGRGMMWFLFSRWENRVRAILICSRNNQVTLWLPAHKQFWGNLLQVSCPSG